MLGRSSKNGRLFYELERLQQPEYSQSPQVTSPVGILTTLASLLGATAVVALLRTDEFETLILVVTVFGSRLRRACDARAETEGHGRARTDCLQK